MSKTISDLIVDVLPSLQARGPMKVQSIFQAANLVLSLLYKELLNWNSDLLCSGDLFLVFQPQDYMAPLPDDFIAMIERPTVAIAPGWTQNTPWLAGKVTSYTPSTQTLIMDATNINGSGTINSWYISMCVFPGMPRHLLGTSSSSVSIGLGSKTFVTIEPLSLVGGENIVVSNLDLFSDYSQVSRMEHEYLNHDIEHDDYWWSSYYPLNYDAEVSLFPRWFKVVGKNLYIRPRSTEPLMVTAKYRQKPTDFTLPTDVIPWDLFYEVFRDGVIVIVQNDIPVPEGTVAFREFLVKRVYSIMSSRRIPIPDKRMNRSLWL